MSPRPSTSSSPTRNTSHIRHSSLPDTPPHTPTRPGQPFAASQRAYTPKPPSFQQYSHSSIPQLMTPPLTPPNPQYIPTPAASRPGSPPLVDSTSAFLAPFPAIGASEKPTPRGSLSRTGSFASLASLALPTLPAKALPLPLPVPVGLTKRHRRLTALLLSTVFLLLALGWALVHLSRGPGGLHLLPLDISLLSSPSRTSSDLPPTSASLSQNGHKRPLSHRPKPLPPSPPLTLTPEQELAALVYHLSSTMDTNSLPAEIDPSLPIDPDYLLGFDTRGTEEVVQAKLRDLVEETWATNPVVVFTKSGPRSREVLQILTSYSLTPPPLEISLDDTRPDAPLLRRALARLTAGELPTSIAGEEDVSLPLLLLGGKPVHRTVRNLEATGELRTLLREAGVGVKAGKAKGGKRRLSEGDA